MSEFLYDDDELEEQHEDGIYGDEDDYGRCPQCGSHGEMIAEGRRHWVVCHDCRTKWRVGTGFFSMFHRDKPKQWDRPRELLAQYQEVEPLTGDDEPESSLSSWEMERLKRLFE